MKKQACSYYSIHCTPVVSLELRVLPRVSSSAVHSLFRISLVSSLVPPLQPQSRMKVYDTFIKVYTDIKHLGIQNYMYNTKSMQLKHAHIHS